MSVKFLNFNIILFIFFQLLLVIIFYFIQPYSFDIFMLMFEKHIEFLINILLIYVSFSFIYHKNFLILAVALSLFFKYIYGIYHFNLFDYYQGYPMSMGSSYDEYTYFTFSKDFSKMVWDYSIIDFSILEKFPLNYMGYPYLMSFVFNIFGVNNWYHIVLNPLLMTLSGIIFYKLFKESTKLDTVVIKIWLLLFIFLPSFNYFSVLNLKDSLLFFFLSISFYSSWKLFISKIFFKLIYFLLLGMSIYVLYFIRVGFIILPILFFFFLNLNKIKSFFYMFIFVLIIIFPFMGFFSKVMVFFRWEYLMLIFSKLTKWTIVKKYSFLIPLIVIMSPLMILLPLPIIYPLSPSIDTHISTEIFKVPINLEYSILSVLLFYFLLNKKVWKSFLNDIGMFPYFKLLLIVFIMLVISNYLTYERHRLVLMLFIYLPIAFVSYQIYLNRINLKNKIFFLLLVFEFLALYWTYTRGIVKGVF